MTKYLAWIDYFHENSWTADGFCPPGAASLSPIESSVIATSVQQFQLGENSDGAGLMRRANEYAKANHLHDFPEAIRLFIREEQRHAEVLGLLLDAANIPRIREHWVDIWFRKIRNLAGLELMLTILTTAELIAVPYYSALHDATDSPVVRKIAVRILADEARHLEFQAENFAVMARSRSEFGRFATLIGHWAAMTAASVLVYILHARFFAKAELSPIGLWCMAFNAHQPIFRSILRVKAISTVEALA